MLTEALDGAGWTVLVALGGETAIEVARQARPDVILLDAVMPGLDGFDTCRRLKADASTRDIPVIFMTGLTETEHVVAGFAAGGIDYVTKPIQPAEVIARVGAHVRTAQQIAKAREALTAEPATLQGYNLTPREMEVLSWVAKGKTNRDIGDILGMSPRTVNKHLEHIFEKLGVETRTAAAAVAMRIVGGTEDTGS
ncbi:MAG: response regulator [Burkholderiales bacterium]|nr:response regulator [Burkholderiales bacterium]